MSSSLLLAILTLLGIIFAAGLVAVYVRLLRLRSHYRPRCRTDSARDRDHAAAPTRLGIAIIGIWVAALATAQTVTQGDPNATKPTEFQSPMIIETVFAPADPSLWKNDEWTPNKLKPWKSAEFTTAEYYDLGKYSCDGLFIREGNNRDGTWNSGLKMEIKKKDAKTLVVVIDTHVTNPGNVHDKFVTLLYEVINGDVVVGTASVTFKVKQNWRANNEENGEETKLTLPADSLKKDPITKLRITMSTKDY